MWYRLQFIGGMKTDISAARNVTLITDSGGGVAALFTADTTQYPSLYEVTGYSEYLDFQAENATAVLTFGEVSSGQKIMGGLIVATISAPIPEPPKPIDPPVFTYTSVGDGGTNVVMDWTSVTGQKFDVYRSTNLTEWALIASNYPAALGGSGTIFDDSLDHEQAFYRVAQTGEVFNKPNVILILFDDLRDHDAFTPYEVLTPNFDRLAERGLRFERAYCQFPVCNSSRASFLTGLRPPTTEVIQNTTVDYKLSSDVVTLPQAFRSNGYYTVSIGKVFHNNEGDGRSWDEDLELINGYTDPINYAKNDDLLGNADTNFYRINDKTYEYLYKGPEDLASYGYTDYHVATDVEAFLDEAASDHLKEPFFLAAGYKKPHNPYIGPSSYFDLYPPETLTLVYDQLNPVPPSYDWATPPSTRDEFDAMDTYHRKLFMSAYSAVTTFSDHQMGLLLDQMDEQGLWDNTIVVCYGDHGYHLGEHSNHWGKVTLYEVSARVPMIVYAPGMKTAGQSTERVVELIDVFPTLAELAGITPPAGLEGESFIPLLIDPDRPWDNEAFTYEGNIVTNLQYTIVTDTHRYTVYPDNPYGRSPDVRCELYDHTVDPGEYTNLVYDLSLAEINASAYSNIVAEMEARRASPSNPNL